LLPLIQDQDATVKALDVYKTIYPAQLDLRMTAKLGLQQVKVGDHELIDAVFRLLTTERTDYTIFWRRLSQAMAGYAQYRQSSAFDGVGDMFIEPTAWQAWLGQYLSRLAEEDLPRSAQAMLACNPKFVLRNHLGEQAITRAKIGDFSEVATLLKLLSAPFEEHSGFEKHAAFPPDWASTISISCSS
jgi:uncharacterized protein YdiU (UPF0061 family)